MKRKVCKIVSVLLACLFGLCATACSGCKGKNKGGREEIPDIVKPEKVFEKTGVHLTENGKTDYKIVIPQSRDAVSVFAASELTEFMRLSSGTNIETMTDNGIVFDSEEKYIYIGEVEQLAAAEISVSKETYGEGGYTLKTVGNSLFIAGVSDFTYYGTIYGVYDFLRYTVGFTVYAADEIVYDTVAEWPLYKFDEFCRPSVDIREMGTKDVIGDRSYAYRMRSIGNQLDIWTSFAHTMISTYLPFDKYGAAHPDWYVNGGEQLCLSSDEVVEEMASAVQARLTLLPETTQVMLGHEDNNTVCGCEKCKAATEKYGGCYSGVELEFTNRVAKIVDKWLEQAYPGRKVTYIFFAYGPTMSAPVVYDELTDTYSPVWEGTEIYENVGVMIAPISMNFSKLPSASENLSEYGMMRGWSALFRKRNLYIWNYVQNYYSYFFNFNNFGVVAEYYKLWQELGVTYIYDQGAYDTNLCTFQDMRVFVQTQLMWDCSRNYDELADEFMAHYYDGAADAMKRYYNTLRAHYKYIDANGAATGKVYFLYDDAELWPIGLVNSILSIFDDAFAAIEPLRESDSERYEKLYNRVQRERISPLYMMLNFYINQLSDEVKTQYLADFEKYTAMFGIESTREVAYDVSGLIETWKKI